MDYNKMINIKRETNVNDNAFAMPPNKKITDTDDGGGSYYGNDIGVEIEDDYSYMIENENEDTVKSVKLSKELLSYFLNEIKNIAVSLLEPYHTHTFTVSVSAITMYTGLQIMSESFADDVSFARVVASASKQAAAYMKLKEKTDDEYMQDTNEILNGMKKVVRAGEE